MRKKIWANLIILMVLLVFSAAGTVYAFFNSKVEAINQPIFSVEDDGSKTITISSEKQLIAYTNDIYYNNDSAVGDVSSENARNTIKFANDITLHNNLIITADCSIDLSGKNLWLNGYSVTVKHTYYGSFSITNGAIQKGGENGRLYVDTPNSLFISDGVIFNNDGLTLESSECITILNENKKYIGYNVFYMAAAVLAQQTSEMLTKLDFSAVDSAVIQNNGVFEFSPSLFVKSQNNAFSGDLHAFYANSDIDLPLNYLGYKDYIISYNSSNTEVISNFGKVQPVPNTVTEVVLTASVSYNNAVFASCSFKIYVIDKNDSENSALVGKTLIENYITKYYNTEVGFYVLNNSISLPSGFSEYGVTFAYSAYASDNSEIADSFENLANTILFLPTQLTAKLKITVTVNSFELVEYYNIQSNITQNNENNYTVSEDIMQSWYGGKITISDSISSLAVNGFSTQPLYTDVSAYADKGVSSVTYSLMNNSYGVYDIDLEHLLYVVSGKDPSMFVETVLVNADFTFTDSKHVQIQVPIVFKDSQSGETNIHGFLPYYIYFNEKLNTVTGGYTSKTFSMPFCYGSGSPIISFDFTENTGFVSLSLYYNGADHFITLAEGENSYTQAIDAYLSENSLTLQDIINYGDAKWNFIANYNLIPKTNTTIEFTYNYKTKASDENWVSYTPSESTHKSRFTLAGIIRNDASGIVDSNLYTWTFNNFNTDGLIYSSGNYILTDWLYQNITFDNTNNSININNYSGIENIAGVNKVLLSNSGINYTGLSYVLQMQGLKELVVSSNALTDRVNGQDNGLIALIAASSVKILDLSNNNFYNFSGFENMVNLEVIYTYNNITMGTDSIFYGSKGLVNIVTYERLTESGVAVYYYVSEIPQLFDTTVTQNDYINLTGVEYQQKLKSGISIAVLYQDLSITPSDYSLADSYTYINGSGTNSTATVSNKSLVWGYVGDALTSTIFTLTYTCRISGVNVSMTINFNITRV